LVSDDWEETRIMDHRGRFTGDGAARGMHQQSLPKLMGFTLIEFVVAAIMMGVPITARAEGSAEPNSLVQAVGAIRDGMAKSPAPWPQAWQEDYVEAIRQVAVAHRDSPGYAARLEILRSGFSPYWEAVPRNDQRSLFEVRQAEIRWYVESLMSAELPGHDERQKRYDQHKDLAEYAARSLLTQFPFLEPNTVEDAKVDYVRECYRNIEAPLLPIFQRPFSGQQAGQLQERWHSLRYARVDLWRQLGGGRKEPALKRETPSGKMHPDYVLAQRSLGQLRGQLWAIVAPAPDFYQIAVTKDIEAQRQRFRSRSDARGQEQRLGGAMVQTEYISFLLAALRETAEVAEGTAGTSGDGQGDGLQGERHGEP